jgi:acyl-CoA thioester hydrolase
MSKHHVFPIRVYIEDTDMGGIVYHANYLKFAERARTEFLREHGFNHTKLIKEQGVIFVVRTCLLNCLASARVDDVLEVRTYLKKLGRAKLEISQTIVREDQLIATLDVVLACISLAGKPIKMDDSLHHMFLTYESNLEK